MDKAETLQALEQPCVAAEAEISVEDFIVEELPPFPLALMQGPEVEYS